MVKVFRDSKTGAFMVQTNCLDVEAFMADLAEAMAALKSDPVDLLGLLQNSMPIAFKLSGYKAETVNEQRMLVCGYITPAESEMVVTVGR